MATDSEFLEVRIEAVITKFEKQMAKASATATRTAKKIESDFLRLDNKLTSFGANAFKGLIGAASALIGVGAIVRSFIQNTQEQEKAVAQLNATLASTGGVAGLTADELLAMAARLQSVSTFSDEAVTSAESLLLTFTRVGRDIFPEATETILDLSTALGQDLKTSSIQVGKALNDPINGLKALRRVGVSFSDAQTAQIKNFVKTGEVAKAQTVILRELQTEFGGSARAARDTLGGALEALGNAFGDLFELQGPAADNLRASIEELIATLNDPATKEAVNRLGSLLFEAFDRAAQEVRQFATDFNRATSELGNLGNDAADAWGRFEAVWNRIADITPEQAAKAKLQAALLGQSISGDFGHSEKFDLHFPQADKGDRADIKRPSPPPPSLGGGGSHKRSPGETFGDDLERIRARTAALNAETAAVGKSRFEAERLRVEQDLLNEAKRAGLDITPKVRAEIEAEANAFATASVQLGQARERFEALNQLGQQFGEGLISSIEGLLDKTSSLNDILADTAKAIRRAALEALFLGQGPLASLFGFASNTGGTGGLIGKIAGFFSGPEISTPPVPSLSRGGNAAPVVELHVVEGALFEPRVAQISGAVAVRHVSGIEARAIARGPAVARDNQRRVGVP